MRRETAMDAKEAMRLYEDFIVRNGNSQNVRRMYVQRVRTFVAARPEALTADEDGLRAICDGYIDSLPVTSAKEVAAAAVRYFWTMRFGKAYFRRIRLSDFERDERIEAEAEAFATFLRTETTIEEPTVVNRLRSVKQFLYVTFSGGAFSREAVTADAVRRYISGVLADAAPSLRSRFATEIRSYARFLMSRGCRQASDIALLPLKAPARGNDVGPTVSDEDYRAILDASSGDDPRQLRDRAITLCMGNLGLRSSDVARLELADVDWHAGRLHVRHSKSKSDRTVPLDEEAGTAIERYVLSSGEGRCGSGPLFLPMGRAARTGSMSPRQVADAVKLLAEKAGVRGYRGAHSLRRAAATNMVSNGVSVKVVADVLGHESVRTTMGYLRLDVESLRAACSPWPGKVAAR